MERGESRPWRKILYERQNYPDNYTAESFLDHLDTSVKNTSMSLTEMADNSSIVALQITILALFLTIFKYIEKKSITLLGIAAIDGIIICIGGIYQIYIGLFKQSVADSLQIFFLFTSCLIIATPVVQSLTLHYSHRTINALTVLFSFLHLFFHDYLFINSISNQFSGNLSINSSVFISILLASRIDNMHVVIFFLLFAVICFILFPECSRFVKQYSLIHHYVICLTLYLITTVLLLHLNKTILIIYQVIIFAVTAVCPLLLRYMQVYKRPLRGHWDVAPIVT